MAPNINRLNLEEMHRENLRLQFESMRGRELLKTNHELRTKSARYESQIKLLTKNVRELSEMLGQLSEEAREHRSFRRLVDRSVLISQETYEKLKKSEVNLKASEEKLAQLAIEAREHRSFRRLADRSVLISQETYHMLKEGNSRTSIRSNLKKLFSKSHDPNI